jgi:hypothetical protein
MAVAVAAAVLAASTQIQSTVTIETFAMQATTVSGTTCTTTPLTSINYGIVPTGQTLPNTSFCLTNTSPSASVYTGGGSITSSPVFSNSGNLPTGVTETWVVGASSSSGCVGLNMASDLTVTAAPASNVWTVTGSDQPAGVCASGATISYFTLAHTGDAGTAGTYTWTTILNAYTTATG